MKNTLLGQTLMEVLITLLIVAAGTISLIRFQNYLAYEESLAQQKEDANLLATSAIETLKNYQALNTTAGYTSYQSMATGSSNYAGTTTTYTIATTVTTTASPAYKNIDIVVSWTDRRGSSQSIRQITDIAAIEPQFSAALY